MSKHDLSKKNGLIECNKFSFENSKTYITALIILFHIFPFVFLAGGEIGKTLLNSYGLVVINPMIILFVMLIYGLKQGFNFKMPLMCLLISVTAIPIYYSFENFAYLLMSTTIFLIVYSLYTFGAILVGSFIKEKIL